MARMAAEWMENLFEAAGVSAGHDTVATAAVSNTAVSEVFIARESISRTWGLSTPEVFFDKAIDNSRLVKVMDPQRKREIAMFSASVVALFLLTIMYTLQHFSSIEYGYKIEAQKTVRQQLIESNRSLKLEEASLRDPGRIDMLARKMGLESPQAGQVVHMDANPDAGGPVMARVSEIAVVTAQ